MVVRIEVGDELALNVVKGRSVEQAAENDDDAVESRCVELLLRTVVVLIVPVYEMDGLSDVDFFRCGPLIDVDCSVIIQCFLEVSAQALDSKEPSVSDRKDDSGVFCHFR